MNGYTLRSNGENVDLLLEAIFEKKNQHFLYFSLQKFQIKSSSCDNIEMNGQRFRLSGENVVWY